MLDWLKSILGEAYTEEIEKSVSEEIGKRFVSRSDFNVVNEVKKGLETQLEEDRKTIENMKQSAGNVEKLESISAQWEEKYNKDTNALKEQLEQAKYTHSIETLSLKEKFSSEAARKAFVADLAAKGLPYEDGKLIGYEDFKKAYMEADPGAFAQETQPPPVYAAGTGTSRMKTDTIKDALLKTINGG